MPSPLILSLILLAPQTSLLCSPLPAPSPATVNAASLRDEVTDFLTTEMAAHLGDIKSYDPAPDKVFNAGTTGEYTWGTFMNAVCAYAELTGKRSLAGRDLAA